MLSVVGKDVFRLHSLHSDTGSAAAWGLNLHNMAEWDATAVSCTVYACKVFPSQKLSHTALSCSLCMFKPTFWYEQVIHMQVLQVLTVGNPLLIAACAAELLMQRN